jgi:serine/threonine protein kinase
VDLFGGENAQVTDEAPTVISKNAPKSPVVEAVAEKAVAGALRGRLLAHFELLEPVGVGGMAAVIRARDTQLDRTVALKVLPPEMADDPENVRRFHQEARSAAKLDHENIARVFFCGEDQKLHFIAFEFVEGDTLRTLMERRGRLPVQESLHYMMQIAAGLAHAAARGVVHRDIKPSNIIISPNGRAKLVDMGLARMAETPMDHALTQSGVTLGTFDYISPEQALEPRDADVRSDIYSLGCTFYHALTGQPPAPEGTAARKLQHHQNEAPIDPRQLNPDIPDDVAMILARMMAKDPKARYQRAEHLLQHLHLAAQKIGTPPGEHQESLQFLDAPLPEPPRTRPLLVAGLAAMILLVSVLFLGRSDRTKENRTGIDPRGSNKESVKESAVRAPNSDQKGSGPANSQAANGVVVPREAATAHDLLEVARENHADDAELNVVLTGNNYEFPLAGDDGVVLPPALTSRKVVLRAKDAANKPTIRFVYDVQKQTQLGATGNGMIGLFIDADECVIENVRFVLDGRGNRIGNMAGLIFISRDRPGLDGATIFVRDCDFVQAGQPMEPTGPRPSSIVLNAPNRKPRVTLENCSFLGYEEAKEDGFKNVKRGGLDAVTLKTPARELVATNCAFGPHYALFRIEHGADDSDLKVRHCAAILVGESAAFHIVGEKTTVKLDVGHSWLAGLNASVLASEHGTALLRQDAVSDAAIAYQGKDNRFHRLDAFWVRPTAADRVVPEHTLAEDSIELPAGVRFWKAVDPLEALERGDTVAAFAVNDQLAQLRSTQDRQLLVGLTSRGSQQFLPAEEKPAVAGRKTVTVDPNVKTEGNNTYPTLLGAFAAIMPDIKPDEEAEILLKYDGFKELSPVPVVDKRIKITIRPASGYRPIVGIGSSSDQHLILIRVLNGDVTLENLEIRVQPNAPLSDTGLRSQALVGLLGEGRCTFKGCWVTLDPAGKNVPLSAVSVSDPEAQQMRMDSTTQAGKSPRIWFENCVVRGDGDLIASHGVRPFEADLNNVWTAISGSLLNGDGARDENASPTEQPQLTQFRLNHVTAYLAGNLVRLRAGNLKQVTAVRVEPTDCIFQAAGSKSVVHLEGPNPGPGIMESLISWSPKNNIYGGFEYRLDNQPPDGMAAPPIGTSEWSRQEVGSGSQISKMAVLTPSGDVVLTQSFPKQFTLKSHVVLSQGVMPDLLPKLSVEAPSRTDGKTD